MPSDDPRKAELDVYWDQLGDQEREILLEVGSVLVIGQRRYGPFDLLKSGLDFEREADEEDIDWIAYRAAAVVQERMRRAKRENS